MKGNARWTKNFTDRSTKLQNTPSTISTIASSVVSEALHVTESGKLSISDAQLNSRGFVLHKSVDKLDLDELNAVFIKVGFPPQVEGEAGALPKEHLVIGLGGGKEI